MNTRSQSSNPPAAPQWATYKEPTKAQTASNRQEVYWSLLRSIPDTAEIKFRGASWEIGKWLAAFKDGTLKVPQNPYSRKPQDCLKPEALYRVIPVGEVEPALRLILQQLSHLIVTAGKNTENGGTWLRGICWNETVFVIPEDDSARCAAANLGVMSVIPVKLRDGVSLLPPSASDPAAEAIEGALPGGGSENAGALSIACNTVRGDEIQILGACAWHTFQRKSCPHRRGNESRTAGSGMSVTAAVKEEALGDLKRGGLVLRARAKDLRNKPASDKRNRAMQAVQEADEGLERLAILFRNATILKEKKGKAAAGKGERAIGGWINDEEDEIINLDDYEEPEAEDSEESAEILPESGRARDKKKQKKRARGYSSDSDYVE